MAAISLTGILILLVILMFTLLLYKTGLFSKIFDAICESSFYKMWFVLVTKIEADKTKSTATFLEVCGPTLKQIEEKATEIGGDVMEIGAGTGKCLDLLRLPEGSSLVVVDYNPFMEKRFRESLAKAPHIKLKDYLVQSATDMSNIPDNTLAVVYTIDVMCSLEIENLRKMLKEIKRVLKPGGCLFFMEHVLDVPGTWRRSLQWFVTSQLGIWPRLLDNCHCDRETWKYIEEAGFSKVNKSFLYLPEANTSRFLYKVLLYFIRRFMIGHAEK